MSFIRMLLYFKVLTWPPKTLSLQIRININPINISNIPPWILHKTNIDLSLTHMLHSQNPEIINRNALYHLQENYPDFVYVYTDGSKTAEKTGSGVYIQQHIR